MRGDARLMLTLDSPVAVLTVPLASCAKVFTTQVEGKPLTSTGGPKKQLASGAHALATPAQSASLVHATLGLLTQWLVDPGTGSCWWQGRCRD